jgi:hypothetical protein
MKTAVSIPDDLFRLAEATAQRLQVSRSQLYAKALSELLSRHRDDMVTERLNEFYSRHSVKLDRALQRAQIDSLEKDQW